MKLQIKKPRWLRSLNSLVRLERPYRFFEICADCGKPYKVLWLTVGAHKYESGYSHIPF